MRADEHLRTALRHAPDRDQQAPSALSAQIVAAAYRAAAEPAVRPVQRRWPWPAWWGTRPLRLGASGALASVLLAGVIGLVWQANPPGPGRDTEVGDGVSPAAASAVASTPESTRAESPEQSPARSPVQVPAQISAQGLAQERGAAVAPRQGQPAAATGGLPGRARQAETQAQATEQRVAAPAAPRMVAAEALTQSLSPAATAAAAPPPPPSPAPVPVPTLPQPTAHANTSDAAPETTMPAPAAVAAADSHTTAPPPRPMAARLAAAAPAALRAPATSLAAAALPWAGVADLSPSWRVQGVATEVDRDWLAHLALLTQGRWVPMPAPASDPAAPDLLWLQDGKLAGRLWLGPAGATWCNAQEVCQSAPLSDAAIAGLKDGLKKKLPR